MNVLIVGSGAREHALAWKVKQSTGVDKIYVAPGNAGTATTAHNLSVSATDIEGLTKAAKDHGIGLTIVGPETSLADGIVDRFRASGLPIFGPSQSAAQIESSKVFAKELMLKYGIPTGRAEVFSSPKEAKRYIQGATTPIVVKADGLAAGKGVTVAYTREDALTAVHQCMEARSFGVAGERVVIEECLEGREVSAFAFSDGETISALIPACDYKRAYDGDRGPNTGGMGSYSPPGFWSRELDDRVCQTIMEPTVAAMAREGRPYQGVLYAGLMITKDGPKVLEFNCRLGDPENQVIMPRLKSDLVEVMLATLEGKLSKTSIEWAADVSVGVVLASEGYPGDYVKGVPIECLDSLKDEVLVFHAGTRIAQDESAGRCQVVTDGGRVMTVVALGDTLAKARKKVYENLDRIVFQGVFYRSDIAAGISL